MSKNIILGTAGHIDHGKTTLIRALTGTNTDRLPEEQDRGITIELGFAHMVLPDDTQVGIVDVPGHEKFVHHMVAGVGGMDMVMLVIAADEGVMPQTREHLSICQLLGVGKGLIALTKTDMADEEWLELVQEDIREYLSGTFLEDAAMIPVSAVTGQGIETLKEAMAKLAADTQPRQVSGPFRLPIDRIFTIRGFGTVVTGTVASGMINQTDTLMVLPGKIDARIRGLQVHGNEADAIYAGQRAAVNLQNVNKEQLKRGMMLTRPHSMPESYMIDAKCRMISSIDKPLKHRAQIRFHTGTTEILGRVVLFDRDMLAPGDEAFVQFRLQSPTANLPGDRFIIRSYSPVQTIGGGEILDAEPSKHKRFRLSTMDFFNALASRDPSIRLQAWLDDAGPEGFTSEDLQRRFPDPHLKIETIIDPLIEQTILVRLQDAPDRITSRTTMDRFQSQILKVLTEWHKKFPLKTGVSREAIRTMLKPQPELPILASAVKDMLDSSAVIEVNHLISHADFVVSLNPQQEKLRAAIHDELIRAEGSGRTLKALQETTRASTAEIKDVIQYILDSGNAIRIPNGLIFDTAVINTLEELVRELATAETGITVGSFRDQAGISRKQAVPLLEYFDSINLTRRQGDQRVLR